MTVFSVEGTAMKRGGPVHRLHHALRMTWLAKGKPHWRAWRAPLLLAMAISVLVLGTIGYHQWSIAQHPPAHYGFLDCLYRAITLFAFAGAVSPPVPVTLEIARILGPVLTGYAAIGTIIILSREQAQLLAIRLLLRRHVVIAGLGYTGSRLALELIEHEPVVVIEADASNEHIPAVKARGVRVLIGDATDPLLLRQAGLGSCRLIMACCGNDGASIDVATVTAAELPPRRFALTACVHLNDLKLWQSLAAESVNLAPRARLRLEYSNVLVLAAELMLERDRLFGSPVNVKDVPSEAHLLFVGLEGPGQQLLLRAARLWRSIHGNETGGLRITITGANAEREVASLLKRYPQIERYCELRARQLAIDSAEFQSGAAMFAQRGCDITNAYVCLLDEGDGMLAALALHSRSEAMHVPVTVIVNDEHTGVGHALNEADSRGANIKSFGVLSETASDQMLTRGINEVVARAKHEQWLRDELANNPQSTSSWLTTWDQLDNAKKEENRRFADSVADKLKMMKCILVPNPLPDPDEPLFSFTKEEVEELAIHEHDRWVQGRIDEGWKYGTPRDDRRKRHPLIVPWEKLSEGDRNKDRDPVRQLPEMLDRVGLKIQRLSDVETEARVDSAAVPAPLPPHDRPVDDLGAEVAAGDARERL